ncbi:MAG: hypothetical protein KDD11_21845 [Acidobacteria bacterium]|nr:hypothetical protein [Acidobacteriota bacterium]
MKRPPTSDPAPPPRPSPAMERVSNVLFRVLAPRLPEVEQPAPPASLEPYEQLTIPRRGRGGVLSATWFPAPGTARGAVLMMPPWLEWGRAYFHRRGRIEVLREAGYAVLTADFSGFGGSSSPHGYFERDVDDALSVLEERCPDRPRHLWGVSSGGYWSHPVLARRDVVRGAMFEDVAPHLIEWSWRTAPIGRPMYLVFRFVTSSAYRFLDIRRHAPFLKVAAATYVSGALDHGVLPADTEELARRTGGQAMVVPEAKHLGPIRVANRRILDLALETFERAEAAAD